MVSSNWSITPYMATDESTDDTSSIWTLFCHTGIYVMAIGLCIPAGLGISARLACWPLQSGSMWHTMVDDDVEAAPIYRCDSKAEQPIIRPWKNHDLCMEQETTCTESQQKQHSQKQFLHPDYWIQIPKSREHD